MKQGFVFAVAVSAALAAAVAGAQGQKPATHYWMSVETRNTTIPGLSAEDSAMMAAMGRDMPGAGAQRSIMLDLSAPGQQPAPEATHDIPPGQNMGKTLPLKTPVSTPQRLSESEPYEKPRGRMLVYWGCGETVGQGQPIVIDFANMDPTRVKLPPSRLGTLQRPPAPARDRVYGTWPFDGTAVAVPRDSSLVGEHAVRGNYPPNIRFTVDAAHDYMAPVAFSSVAGGLADAINFQWNGVPNATGYFAMAIGGVEKNSEMILWTSSELAEMGGGLTGFVPPAQVQRLIQERVVLSAQTTRCAVPQGIFKNAQGAMLQLHAYGDELNHVYPPKPADPKARWDSEWYVKVRLKSTGMTPLGSEDSGGRSRGSSRSSTPSQQTPAQKAPEPARQDASPNPLDAVKTLKGLFGF
jgi:hypothetical protein